MASILQALNRVGALVREPHLKFEQGHGVPHGMSQGMEMQDCLLPEGLAETGHSTLAHTFGDFLRAEFEEGDAQERPAWLQRLQDERRAMIRHLVGETGNLPAAQPQHMLPQHISIDSPMVTQGVWL